MSLKWKNTLITSSLTVPLTSRLLPFQTPPPFLPLFPHCLLTPFMPGSASPRGRFVINTTSSRVLFRLEYDCMQLLSRSNVPILGLPRTFEPVILLNTLGEGRGCVGGWLVGVECLWSRELRLVGSVGAWVGLGRVDGGGVGGCGGVGWG